MKHFTYRSHDGTYNNLTNVTQGCANSQLRRIAPADYADHISQPAVRGNVNPNPRIVSNKVCRENYVKFNSKHLTDFMWAWSQFIHNEIEMTSNGMPAEPWNIPVHRGDPALPKGGTIEYCRSAYDLSTGSAVDKPRQQINLISSYIDGTNVYGFDYQRARTLRLNDGSGKLKTSQNQNGYLLPMDRNCTDENLSIFITGDTRANDNAVLSSLHTLFVREHNRLCEDLLYYYPSISGHDETIYQLARAMVVGMIQAITYNEYLPALLGNNALPEYWGYRETTDATISNIFSTVCSPVVLTMFSDVVPFGRNGKTIALKKLYRNSKILIENGIEPLLDGLYRQTMREVDGQIVDDARNFLYGPDNGRMVDIAALNVQRGRDHGLPDLNTCRRAVGLEGHHSFESITSNAHLAKQLEATYGDVNAVDPWVGGLVEDHVNNAAVGEFVYTVYVDQFARLRDGDRFWYQVDPLFHDKPELQWTVSNTRLADVIRRNTLLDDIPDRMFTRSPANRTKKSSISQDIDSGLSPDVRASM